MKLSWFLLSSLCFAACGQAQQVSPPPASDSAAIGLAAGLKAPTFSLRDQFGRLQTNESLRGTKGTVVLFFRSADW